MTTEPAVAADRHDGQRGTVVMELERCKGCGLCVPVCMPGVLEMTQIRNEKGYVVPRLLPGCTGCRACADVCPDFVFEVYRFDRADGVG